MPLYRNVKFSAEVVSFRDYEWWFNVNTFLCVEEGLSLNNWSLVMNKSDTRMQFGCSSLGCGHAWWRHVTEWAEGVSLTPLLITWLDHLVGRMGDFQCTGLFASASKKGFHARLAYVSVQWREYAPLSPPPTFCFETCLEEKMGYCHSNHTGSKVAEMVVMRCSISMKASNWIWRRWMRL